MDPTPPPDIRNPQAAALARGSLAERLRALETGDDIYAQVFEAILEQRLLPGVKLTEEGLGEIFGVSRTLIRKSLLRLAFEGVVEMRHNRGARVAEPTFESASQVFEARRVIEESIARLVAQRITPADVDELTAFAQLEREAFDRAEFGRAMRLSGEFHLMLALVADNQPLFQFMRALVSQTSLIGSRFRMRGGHVCSTDEHVALVREFAARDGDRAAAAMRAHRQQMDERHVRADSPPTSLERVFTGARPVRPAG